MFLHELSARISNFTPRSTHLITNGARTEPNRLTRLTETSAQPRQRGIDTSVGEAGRRPAIDVAVGQPDHQKSHQPGGGNVGKEVPAERHPEQAGYCPKQGRGGVGQRSPSWRRQRRGRKGPERGRTFAREERAVSSTASARVPPWHERLIAIELRH